MGLSSLLFFSLLLTAVSALRKTPKSSSCSANFFEEHHHHHLHVNTSGIHLTLHHAHGPCSPLDLPPTSSAEFLQRDVYRAQALVSRLAKSTTTSKHSPKLESGDPSQSTISVPLSSGTSLGVGNYVTKIGLGTPTKEYIVVVDTGSSLTWLQCQPCKISCYSQQGPIFNPTASSTYSSVSCSTPECNGLQVATLNPSGCSQSKVCIYQASYGDSSFSVGYLSKDTLSFGSSPSLSGFVYGCGQDNEGLFGKSAGLIGLAKDKLSLLGQLSSKYGNAFSYCLPTTSSSGYLSIGSYSPAKYTFTPIAANSLDKSLYFVKLAGIVVGQKPIAVPASAYSGTPTIIDSGTVITRLPTPAYTALSQAIVGALKGYARAPAYSLLDTCFKGTLASLPVPEVKVVFAGGAELKLSAHNVFYDVTSGTTCLAFAPSSSIAIIGNRQQQTFGVVYDVAAGKIGFAAGGCS